MPFNAPPQWPDPPADWVPSPGWMPNEALPSPAEGWPYWMSEAGHPMQVLNSQVPPWDPRSVLTPPADTLAPAPVTFADNDAEVAAAQRKAMMTFLGGAALFLIGAGSAIFAAQSAGGGLIWTGGMLFGAILFWRAWRMHRAVHSLGGRGTPASKVVVGLGAAACAVLGGITLFQYVAPSEAGGASGSCWNDATGGMLQEVSCGAEHQYEVTSWVADPDSCPMSSEFYVEESATRFGCLKEG